MAIRALAFDVFGTLVDWRSGVADAFRASGVSGDPYELADAWRARYRTAARLLGVQPAELMLVAAHPWDLEGARNAGLKTAFVDRPLEYGPDSEARADPNADEAVGDLRELAARLSPV